MKTISKAAMIGVLTLSLLLIPLASNSISYAGEPVTSSICVSINENDSEIKESLAKSSENLMHADEGQIFEVVVRYKDTLGVQLADDQIGYIPVSDATPFIPIITLEADWVTNNTASAISLPKTAMTEHNLFNLSAPITSVATFKPEEDIPEPQPEPEVEEPAVEHNEPSPSPEPEPETKPEPKPEPKPAVTVPEPEPEPAPEPKPVVPIPEPEPEPTPEPEPVSDSLSYLSSTERTMFRLVNQVRADYGLPALKLDTRLTDIARLKSQDIIDLDYFSHISPTYGSPIDMLKSYGIDYRGMGENLAGDQSVEKAHKALVDSPGHLENILNPNFTHMGIGIQSGGRYENVYTQLFIGKP